MSSGKLNIVVATKVQEYQVQKKRIIAKISDIVIGKCPEVRVMLGGGGGSVKDVVVVKNVHFYPLSLSNKTTLNL